MSTRTRKLSNRFSQIKEKLRRNKIADLGKIKIKEVNELKAEENRLRKLDQEEKLSFQIPIFLRTSKDYNYYYYSTPIMATIHKSSKAASAGFSQSC